MDDICGASDCSGPMSDPEAGMQSNFLFSEVSYVGNILLLLTCSHAISCPDTTQCAVCRL